MAILKKTSIGTGTEPDGNNKVLVIGDGANTTENIIFDNIGNVTLNKSHIKMCSNPSGTLPEGETNHNNGLANLEANTKANTSYFNRNVLLLTEQLGKYDASDEKVIMVDNLKNTSIESFIINAFSQDKDSYIKEQPSCNIILNEAGTYEPGTEITITYTKSFSCGKYSYSYGHDRNDAINSEGYDENDIAKTNSTEAINNSESIILKTNDTSENGIGNKTINGSGTLTITIPAVNSITNFEAKLSYSCNYSDGKYPLSLLAEPQPEKKLEARNCRK